MEIIVADSFSYDAVCDEVNAHAPQTVDFKFDDSVRKTELRNSVFQYAADLVQCFEHGNFISALGHVAGKRESGRPGTDDGDAYSVGRHHLRNRRLTALSFVIRREAFKITDGYGFFFHLQMYTLCLTLFFLRADTTADSRQAARFFQRLGCLQEVARFDIFNKCRDVDADRTSAHACGIGAVETSLCFLHGLVGSKSEVDFFMIAATVVGIKLIHPYTRNIGAFFAFLRFAQSFSPGLGTPQSYEFFCCHTDSGCFLSIPL